MERNLSNKATGGMLPGVGLDNEHSARRYRAGIGAGLVKFNGNDFTDEQASNLVFQIKLVNTDVADRRIVLHPGVLKTLADILKVAGVDADAIAVDGVVIADKVSCATRGSLAFLQAFINQNPTRIVRLQITGSDEAQMGEAITLTKVNPITKLGSIQLIPDSFKKATDTNAKLVSIDLKHYQLDDQSVWDVNVLAGKTITINAYLGAIRNDAATLESLAIAALGE